MPLDIILNLFSDLQLYITKEFSRNNVQIKQYTIQ